MSPASGPPSQAPAAGSAAAKRVPIWEPLPDELPSFSEPGEGARAPDNQGFHVRLGETRLPEVQALTARFGPKCANRSIRAVMKAARESKAREVLAAKTAGQSVDTVTGASVLMYWSPREKTPQVRWSCEDIDMNALGDRPRPSFDQSRLLYVFDSEALPVRHASLQRSWPKARVALAVDDVRRSLAALKARFGQPTNQRGELPAPGTSPEIPPMRNFLWEWKYADLQVKLNAVNLPKGLVISEDVEVPVPVRPDAPARPSR